MRTYYPNESIRFTTGTIYVVTSVGLVVYTPASLSLIVVDANGGSTTYVSTLTADAPGQYHQDVTLPASPAFGRWKYYWTSTGSLPTQQGLSTPQFFQVSAP
jgi:hypothetical protein